MKKLILAALVAGLMPMIASAQGTIAFSSAGPNNKVVDVGNVGVGAGYSATLYWGVLGSVEANLVQIGALTPVTAGGFLTVPATRTTGVATPEGANATFQVRAWNGAFSTYEDALASGTSILGKTALFTNGTGAPNGVPPSVPAALSGWTSPLVVSPVPEPGTLALAGLGAASLLLFRRKK